MSIPHPPFPEREASDPQKLADILMIVMMIIMTIKEGARVECGRKERSVRGSEERSCQSTVDNLIKAHFDELMTR